MIKTRFAPSPTGVLHVGGARTALFSWLYAKKMGGKFVLRIEDTDLERSTETSVKAILDGMAWLNLDHDEGPYYQTHRFDQYAQVIQQLVEQGDAYYCSCSKERLEKLREGQMAAKEKPRYDGCCRDKHLSPKNVLDLVIRFKNPQEGKVEFNDAVKGSITVANAELDDLIIARTDGTPTYNLTVVVDDMDMKITHVVRGDDHVNNTPRQINILKALGADLPVYAHVPMILGDDGKRLSKRHGAVGVMQYFDDGFLPDAMLNYLVRLGWSHGDQELFSREEMIELFDLADINRSASIFNTEKLQWINQQYLQNQPLAEISELVRNRLLAVGVELNTEVDISILVDLYRQRSSTVNELVDSIMYCFQDFDEYDSKAAKKALRETAIEPLMLLKTKFADLEEWKADKLHQSIDAVTTELEIGMGKVGQPLRVAVTGGGFSPPIDQTVEIIGREKTMIRIDQAIDFIRTNTVRD
jgi:glutamyl-tRNA synthetase